MRKLFFIAAMLLCAATYAAVTNVGTYSQLVNAVSYSSDTIRLTADITYEDADGVLYVPGNATRVIDLDLHKIQRNVTHSSSAIRPTITMGRNSNLTLLMGDVVCNNTLVDAAVVPCAVYLPAEGATLNLADMTLIGLVNNANASNTYGVILGDQDNLTLNARLANIHGLYSMNSTYTHTVNIYRCYLGTENRKNGGALSLKVQNTNHLQGAIAMGEIHGTNLSAAKLLTLIPDEDMKYFDRNNDSYTEITRAQIAQMSDLQSQSLYFFPDLNFSIGSAVTYTNCDDILGNGTARFDFLTNTLYLKNTDPNNAQTIPHVIYWTNFDLTIDVEGKWRSSQLESYGGNLTVRGHHHAMTGEDADMLSVKYVADEPFAIHGADIKFENRIKIYAESDRTTDPVFTCHNITVDDSWLDAFGKKPIANCSYYFVTNASYKTGSFRNHDVLQIEPNFTQYYIRVQTNGDDRGSVSGEGWYNEGTEATITATANEGYYFDRWYEDGSTDATRTVTVTESRPYTALFFPEEVTNYYNVDAVSADETMGIVRGGGEQIEEGTVITLSATPFSGYEFMYWTNSQGYRFSNNPFSYTVGSSDTYTAHFREIPSYTSYSIYLNGTQITSDNQNDVLGDGIWMYDETTNTLTTMGKKTYNISNTDFIDNYISTPLTIVLNHSITINASTTDTSNDIVLYSAYGFHITGTPLRRLTIKGTDMRLVYAAFGPLVIDNVVQLDAQQTITSWGETNLTTKCAVQLKGSDDALTVSGADVYIKTSGSSLFKVTNRTDANLSLIRADIISGAMDGTTLNISNDVSRYILHYSNGDLENICPVYGGFGFHYPGEVITIEAFPKEGYRFVQWSDGVTDNPRVITMPEHNVYLDPIVEEDGSLVRRGAIINANAMAGEGTISGFESGWYAEGSVLSITAVPEESYTFVQWSDGETSNPYILTVEDGKNVSITAVFQAPTTGIDEVQGDDVQSTKVLRDGVLYIERNHRIYNAQGAQMK